VGVGTECSEPPYSSVPVLNISRRGGGLGSGRKGDKDEGRETRGTMRGSYLVQPKTTFSEGLAGNGHIRGLDRAFKKRRRGFSVLTTPFLTREEQKAG